MNNNELKIDYGYINTIISDINNIKAEFTANQKEGLETVRALKNERIMCTEKTDAVLAEAESQFTKVQEYIDYLEEFKLALNDFINKFTIADK